METWIFYSLKVSLGLVFFYLLFKILISRDTFFRFNRFVLLGGVAACCLLPSMPIETQGRGGVVQETWGQLETLLQAKEAGDGGKIMKISRGEAIVHVVSEDERAGMAVPNHSWSIISLWLPIIIYLSGFVAALVWLVAGYGSMIRMIRNGRKQRYSTYVLVLSARPVCPFCWGKYIVMSESDYNNNPAEILTHEKMHQQGFHTLDLMFMDLCVLLFWFNPAMWLLKKELQEIHEYEADNGVINQGIDATKYQLLLVKKAVGARLYSIANSLNHSKLKNRITMMLKKKSNRWARLKILFFIPLAACLMLAFARPDTTLASVGSVPKFKVMQNFDSLEILDVKPEKKSPQNTTQVKVSDKLNSIVAWLSWDSKGRKQYLPLADAQLKSILDTADLGKRQNVGILITEGWKEQKEWVDRIVAEKNWKNVSVEMLQPGQKNHALLPTLLAFREAKVEIFADIEPKGNEPKGKRTRLIEGATVENISKLDFKEFKGLSNIRLKVRDKVLQEKVLEMMKEQGITDIKIVP